jgi:hypothetical protein
MPRSNVYKKIERYGLKREDADAVASVLVDVVVVHAAYHLEQDEHAGEGHEGVEEAACMPNAAQPTSQASRSTTPMVPAMPSVERPSRACCMEASR